ncbi:MAG: FimB/Mfa2 family fimbrial subunit [Muribaculaceae bacterium]|nr:FimB/Mfa2 family fimbrial subunit [Muribaculaceae bacterium]
MKIGSFNIPFPGMNNIVSGMFPILMAMALLGLTVSCDVHQFPEQKIEPEVPDDPDSPDNPPLPDDPDLYVDLNLALVYDTPMFLWEHFYDPKLGEVVEQYPDADVDGFHPGTTQRFDGLLQKGLKNVSVQFFPKGSTGQYSKIEKFVSNIGPDDIYDMDLPIRLMPGYYDIVVWSDFKKYDDDKEFYDASNFNSIKIDYDNYSANSDHRDSFRGRESAVNIEEDKSNFIVVEMRRPMAKYEFVTTDLSEFLDRETERRNLSTRASIDDYIVKIFYSTYHPSAYSAVDDILRDSTTGVNFQTEVTVTGESEASLGFDYVFINDTQDGAIQATIAVFDKKGENVAQSVQISVPLRRDHHTMLRGAFLTMNGSGGVGIDPGYNGDHNIIP